MKANRTVSVAFISNKALIITLMCFSCILTLMYFDVFYLRM